MDRSSPSTDSRFRQMIDLVSAHEDSHPPSATLLEGLLAFHREMSGVPPSPAGVREALEGLVQLLRSGEGSAEDQVLVRDFVLTENDWEMDWSHLPEDLEDVLFQLATSLPLKDQLNGSSPAFVDNILARLRSLR